VTRRRKNVFPSPPDHYWDSDRVQLKPPWSGQREIIIDPAARTLSKRFREFLNHASPKIWALRLESVLRRQIHTAKERAWILDKLLHHPLEVTFPFGAFFTHRPVLGHIGFAHSLKESFPHCVGGPDWDDCGGGSYAIAQESGASKGVGRSAGYPHDSKLLEGQSIGHRRDIGSRMNNLAP